MALSGFLFLSWRIFQIITLIPIVGMLAWFVNGFVDNNQLTPNYILVLFIVSVLALAWAFFTTISYLRARHDAIFVALVDLGFVGALIAGVVVMRFIAGADCSDFEARINIDGIDGNSSWNFHVNKVCAMLKASFALGIINILAFFVTFLLALLVHRHHRDDDRVVVKREYHSSRHGHRRSGSRARSRDYDYRPASSGRRSTHRSSSRRQYYV
ncbi:hypothetical protein CLAFUW4_01601 [Fulvia fulva]|uniref:MARVEL domain-containing protein n=1 Tax=Passalora fulva TaxID=5499 RepID=A0A9Q8L6B1_PASFU|nr:uncharacterized protein CLAFUR5_01601 [Fulvia fulva]KAK4635642.1 hypothetical protein CLAFUR4_01599 [Fulvia fulva]KAK4637192.1 hypothetical protein CLAFUR0_01600 [Fulvia fulva]UJO11650.1 hypothetical protein CLAFUR5_01601 [Fulvia fulva]WPV08150.1 hypothetical protein CLAFUW4_01601 [Fulvia fulva]WPV23760.1 hypothetical protein CLAFUW7_01603 [Fulvia fulva]